MTQLWICPQCRAHQFSDEVQTVEIVEPGKNPRTEYHGRIRPTYRRHRIYNDPTLLTFEDHPYIEYSCLVCGHTWGNPPDPEDPTPGGASVTFLYPITEHDEECDGDCLDRDCC